MECSKNVFWIGNKQHKYLIRSQKACLNYSQWYTERISARQEQIHKLVKWYNQQEINLKHSLTPLLNTWSLLLLIRIHYQNKAFNHRPDFSLMHVHEFMLIQASNKSKLLKLYIKAAISIFQQFYDFMKECLKRLFKLTFWDRCLKWDNEGHPSR